MKRIPKTVMAAALLAAFAVGQEPNQDYQTPQEPAYAQPEMPVAEPTYVQPNPAYMPNDDQQPTQEPVVQPTEPNQPAEPVEPPAVDRPLEIIDISTIPDAGPPIKDWAPTPPGEMNPRTGIVEPNWNNIGTGIPDYSQPAKPDDEGFYSANEEKDDRDWHDVHKYPTKERRAAHWDRHWDSGWKWSPHSWGDW